MIEIDPDGAELQYCGSYRIDMPCELEACKKSYPPKNVFNRGGKPKRWLVFKEYLWG
ncbi:hypothetical protein DJ66_0537 [Candidatus Liberibacter solanacearum]|uniref:Uncharacterized protein n=1 Tax=Candidatus Liberibacter solanacearum TaxID=556287 RepID=A0A0F4VKP0_9HYPH|nr:hypothetical protein [Candidatus Liberibacter solanacearum]KJZ81810.1 hypothetical protein DJ66_0537 [Candidatus Liberibacter solanacearum]